MIISSQSKSSRIYLSLATLSSDNSLTLICSSLLISAIILICLLTRVREWLMVLSHCSNNVSLIVIASSAKLIRLQPQEVMCPSRKEYVLIINSLPQEHLQCQHLRPFFVLLKPVTVSWPKHLLVRSGTWLQPHDVLFPVRRELEVTVFSLPHSHLHNHWTCPLFVLVSRDLTTQKPNLWPARLISLPIYVPYTELVAWSNTMT